MCTSCGESFRNDYSQINNDADAFQLCPACSGDLPFTTIKSESPVYCIEVENAVGIKLNQDMTKIEAGISKEVAFKKGHEISSDDIEKLNRNLFRSKEASFSQSRRRHNQIPTAMQQWPRLSQRKALKIAYKFYKILLQWGKHMELIERLNIKELSELISKTWMTHDGMWFYNCFLELGIEKTNKLNKAAISSLAAIEINRFKKAFGIKTEKIESFEELKLFFASIAEILIPEFMNVNWSFPEENILRWEFNEKKCFAFNGMKLLGITSQYECGPIHRIECWLKVLGINYEINPMINKCISPNDGQCSGKVIIHFE